MTENESPKWLLSDEDYNECTDRVDWLFFVLDDNGITSNETSQQVIISSITDFETPDCPWCKSVSNNHYKLSDGRWKCRACKKKYSLTSCTHIDNTKLPLTHWWRFAWIVAKHKKMNSCEIAKDLHITQKSAWHMIDTLKKVMAKNNIDPNSSLSVFKNEYCVLKLLMQRIN